MKTGNFIAALAADERKPGPPPGHALAWGLIASVAVAAAVFVWRLGPRPDFMPAMHTMRFDFKFVVTAILAASSFAVALYATRPGTVARRLRWVWSAPALMLAAVLLELLAMPMESWMPRMIGTNSMLCLRMIPMLSLAPLAIMLYAFSFGAPSSPGRAGAIAGLIAGGIGAFFYAAHCFDDSPLFVALWYSLAIGAVTALGALIGSRILRW